MANRSESIELLAAALVQFHSKCPKIFKDSFNPQLRSKYADLGSILGEINPILSSCGLAIVQVPFDEVSLETMLIHTSGQFLSAVSTLRPQDAVVRRGATSDQDVRAITPQAYGSALTYQRRYALAAMLSLCIDDDDDGQASQKAAESKANPTYAPTQAAPPNALDGKPEPQKPMEKLTDEKIAEIQEKISEAGLEMLPKCEQALNAYGIGQAIDKTRWSMLACFLIDRWIQVSALKDLAAIGNKIVGYRSKGLVTEDQQKMLTEEINKRLAEAKK